MRTATKNINSKVGLHMMKHVVDTSQLFDLALWTLFYFLYHWKKTRRVWESEHWTKTSHFENNCWICNFVASLFIKGEYCAYCGSTWFLSNSWCSCLLESLEVLSKHLFLIPENQDKHSKFYQNACFLFKRIKTSHWGYPVCNLKPLWGHGALVGVPN